MWNLKAELAYTVPFMAVNVALLVLLRGGGRRLYLRKGDWRRLCLVHLPLVFCLGNYTWNWGSQEHLQSHTLQFLCRPFMALHTRYTHAHALIRSVMCTHTHINLNRPFFFAFCLPFAVPSSSRSPFLFPLTGSVSIRCDIPFCFLITSLCFVLLEPNNFIDDGHKTHTLPVKNCTQAQTQIHGVGVHVSPAASLTTPLPLRVTCLKSAFLTRRADYAAVQCQ